MLEMLQDFCVEQMSLPDKCPGQEGCTRTHPDQKNVLKQVPKMFFFFKCPNNFKTTEHFLNSGPIICELMSLPDTCPGLARTNPDQTDPSLCSEKENEAKPKKLLIFDIFDQHDKKT